MVNDKIANDIAGLQASRLNNVIDPNPQYTDTTFSKEVTELFDPSCLAYLDSEGRLCVDSVTVSSEIIFNYPFTELMEKGVEEIRIQFTVEGEGSPVFAGFGLGSSTVKDFKSYEIVINDTVNVDETISTLSFSKEDVAYYMKTGLFRLYLVFLQGNSVCNVKLSNVIVTFTYTNNIVNEVKVIENRLEALGFTGGGGDVVDLIYPVGSIYMSVNSTSPSTLFGGTWEQIEDTFLLASGSTYENGSTGGASTVALTKAEMPRHNHTQAQHRHKQTNKYSDGNSGSASGYTYTSNRSVTDHYTDYQAPVINHTGGTGTTNEDANGSPHENMPPYLAVNVWKRTA